MMRARLSLFSSQSQSAPWPVVLVFVLCIMSMSISGSISISSVLGAGVDAGVGVGDRVYINFANIMSGLNSGSVFNNDPCADQPGTATRQEIAVDYLIVGGGPGGLQTASELLSALRNSTDVGERTSSVMLVEAQNEIGGNIKRVKIIQPSDYDGSFGSDGLYADLGAQRVNVLTLTEERRLFHQLGIELYATPFRNIVNLRGRQLWCRTPDVQAHEHFPYYASTPDPADVFAYGDFCTYADVFTHPDTGAYKNVRSRTNFQGCTNTDNTAENVCTSFPNNDPGYNAYQWLLQGSDAPSFDAHISGTTKGANYFYGANYKHPLNPNKTCTVGVNCPIDRCLQYPDWKSFVAGELAHGDMRYNNEYASFMQGDNVGFYGDYEQGFGACSYINYQAREWNTAGVNLYPKGGMFSLISGLRDRITRLGGTIHTNERVTCIRRVTPSTASSTCSGAAADFTNTRYVVTTRSYRIFVRKFLFMAVPNPYLEDTTSIGGDVLNSLRAKRPFARSRAQTTATVTMQWQPGQKAWYWDLLDKTGNYSIRQYGDTACFSRIEIVDTPFHRCTNAMKAVYSDFRCRQMYIDLISAAQTSGDYTKLKNRVLIDLQDAFPNVTIPEPILTVGQIFNPAWYWAKPSHDDISNEAHAEWAANPLDNEPICMIGEAYHTYYQGWVEGALRSSRQCLATRLASTPDNQGKLADQLLRGYAARDAIVPGDGSYASKFQEVTPHSGSRYFSNEQWWPYKYDAVPSTGFCHKANHPFVNYKNATVTP